MQKAELNNYIFRKVELKTSTGEKFYGFLKALSDSEAILSNLYYGKDVSVPLESIISVRVLTKFGQRSNQKNYP